MPSITYLIPVYNEIKTIREAIKKVLKFNFKVSEILIIDNGSTDGSAEIIREFKKNKKVKIILKNKNLGWGDTFRLTLKLAKGKYLFIHHSDNEYDLNLTKKMFRLCEKYNYDVVFGSRLKNLKSFSNYIVAIKRYPYFIATLIFTNLINILYNKNFTDTSGTKFYRLSTVKKIRIINENVSFEYEQVCRLCEPGVLSKEVFTKYKPRENYKDKKVKWYHLFIGVYDIIYTRFFRYKKLK